MKSIQVLSVVMAGVLSAGGVLAKDPDHPMRGQRRAEIQQWRQKMQEQMKAQDAELDKLQQQINTASGPEKVDALAAAVSALIQQRKTMHSEMESLHQRIQEGKGARRGGAPEMQMSPVPGGAVESPSPGVGEQPAQ